MRARSLARRKASTQSTGVARARMARTRTPRARVRTLRYAAAIAVLVLPAAAACGIQPSGITKLGAAPAALGASALPSLDTSPGSTQFLVYFYQNGQLEPAYRPGKGEVTEATVYTALVGGPNPAEAAAGFTSAVPTSLIVKARAADEAGAYNLSAPLGPQAKAQFICTMQYFDQIDSIGIQIGDARPIWNACGDTTSQFIPMRGDGSSTSIPSPTPSTGN